MKKLLTFVLKNGRYEAYGLSPSEALTLSLLMTMRNDVLSVCSMDVDDYTPKYRAIKRKPDCIETKDFDSYEAISKFLSE